MTLLFSLTGGLLIAVALQLVTANLGIAVGLTLLNWRPQDHGDQRSDDFADSARAADPASSGMAPPDDGNDQEASAPSEFSLPITHLLGFSVAAGLSMVLFVAALLSAEFSQLVAPRRGVIFGLILWATYWLLFIWLSSTTVAIAANSLLGTAIAGGQRLLTAITHTLSSADSSASPSVEQSILKDLSAEISQIASVQKELPALLASQQDTLIAEICDRTHLSSTEVQRIIEAIDPDNQAHRQSRKQSRRQSLKQPAHSDESQASEKKAAISISAEHAAVAAVPPTVTSTSPPYAALVSQLDLPSWQSILKQALTQVDLSDWDIETLLQQLPQGVQPNRYAAAFASNSTTLTEKPALETAPADYHAAIESMQSKLIAYCRYTNPDLLTPEHLAKKIDAQCQMHDLPKDEWCQHSIDIESIESVLHRRKKLSEQKKQQLINTLRQSCPAAATSQAAQGPTGEKTDDSDNSGDELSVRAIAHKAYQILESHLAAVDWSQVSLEDVKPEIVLLLDQLESGSLQSLDWAALSDRIRIPSAAKAEFVTWLKEVFREKLQMEKLRIEKPDIERLKTVPPSAMEAGKLLSQQLSQKITQLLTYQEKSALQPDKLTPQLAQIVVSTLSTVPRPAELVSTSDIGHLWQTLWNRDTWQQALENRKDLTTEEIQQLLSWGETVWQLKAQQVGDWLQAAQAEAQKLLSLPLLSLPMALPDVAAVETARQRVVNQIVQVQERLSERAIAAQAKIQHQANTARQQVAIAAWWIFIALISSGSAAAGAGWLAATY
ncbi:MAG: hypothetical protein AAFQ40_01665 [Cyanobacteria bacterium J06623_5]